MKVCFMPNAFKFKNPNVDPDKAFKLTDTAKRLFAEALPGQGFVGAVDLLTGELHLAPFYETEDAKAKMTDFLQQYAVMESPRTSMGVAAHETLVSQLKLTSHSKGQFLGYGGYKGKGDSLVDAFANRSASLNISAIEYNPDYLEINPNRTSMERSIPDTITTKIMDVLSKELPVDDPAQKRNINTSRVTTVKYSTEAFNALSDEEIKKLKSDPSTADLRGNLFKPGYKELLSQATESEINKTDFLNRSLLMVAVNNNSIEHVKALLAHGASVNITDVRGNTALSMAVEMGNFLIAKELYEHYATTDLLTRTLIFAANGNLINSSIVEKLPDNASAYQQKTMDSLLIFAIKNGESPAVIKDLIEKGASVKNAIEPNNSSQNTALITAVIKGDLPLVETLLEQGASVDAENLQGRTALLFAAAYGSPEMVKTLLDHGASINKKDKNGLSIMSSASSDNKALLQEALDKPIESTMSHRV
jgi:ankyrin repeat protein